MPITVAETLAIITALEMRILDPEVRASPTALAELLADDLLEYTPAGVVYSKASIIAAMAAAPRDAWSAMSNVDYALRPLAEDVVLLTYRHLGTRKDGTEVQSLRSSIWKRADSRWQLAFHQGTMLPAGA